MVGFDDWQEKVDGRFGGGTESADHPEGAALDGGGPVRDHAKDCGN